MTALAVLLLTAAGLVVLLAASWADRVPCGRRYERLMGEVAEPIKHVKVKSATRRIG